MLGVVTGLHSAPCPPRNFAALMWWVTDRGPNLLLAPIPLSFPFLSPCLGLSLDYKQLSSDFPFAQREGLRNPCWSTHPSLSGSGGFRSCMGCYLFLCTTSVSPGGLAGVWPDGTGRRMLAHVSAPATPHHHGFAAFPGRTGSLRFKSAD